MRRLLVNMSVAASSLAVLAGSWFGVARVDEGRRAREAAAREAGGGGPARLFAPSAPVAPQSPATAGASTPAPGLAPVEPPRVTPPAPGLVPAPAAPTLTPSPAVTATPPPGAAPATPTPRRIVRPSRAS